MKIEGAVLHALEAIAGARATQEPGGRQYISGEQSSFRIVPANNVADFVEGQLHGRGRELRLFGLMPTEEEIPSGPTPRITFRNQTEEVEVFVREDGSLDFQRRERIDVRV